MFPIPDPSRLLPPEGPPSGGHVQGSFAEGILALGGFVMMLGAAIGAGALASLVSPWLAIPGGLLGLTLVKAVCDGPIILCGTIETLFYAGVTFVFTGGLDMVGSVLPWIGAWIVAAVFAWATYVAWEAGS